MELVGRGREIAALVRLVLVDGARRPVVVTGLPGVGKSALLAEAMQAVARERVTVWRVDLRSATEGGSFAEVIARALGVWPSAMGSASATEMLTTMVGSSRIAIAVDHADAFDPADPSLADFLVRAHRATVVLATSRVRADAAPADLTLHPLPVPAPGATPREARQSPAVQLFRSAAERVGIAVDGDEAILSASAICRLVGGLPLAIELAAARTRLLPLDRLADELGADPERAIDIDLLKGRRVSIRDALEATCAALSTDQRDLLERLSAFHGRFPIDAAVAVSGRALGAVIDDLERLVDLRLVEPSAGGAEPELGLLPIVRAFLRERRPHAGEQQRRAYLREVAAEAAKACADLRSSEAIERLRALRHDIEVELRGLAVADRRQAVGLAVQVAPVLEGFEVAATISDVLNSMLREGDVESLDPGTRARAWLWSSRLLALSPDGAAMADLVTQRWAAGFVLVDDHAEPRLGLQARLIAVYNGPLIGDLLSSGEAAAEALRIAQSVALPGWAARFEMWAAGAAHITGRPEAAIELALSGLHRAQRIGDVAGVAWAIMLLNTFPLELVPDHAPVPPLEEGLILVRRCRDFVLESFMYAALTMREQRAGRTLTAAYWCARRVELGMRRGWAAFPGLSLVHAALLASALGDDEASAMAARLIGVVQLDIDRVLRSMAPSSRPLFDDAVRRVRTRLGDERFTRHVAEGGMLTAADASAVALDWLRRHAVEPTGKGKRPSVITTREREVLALLASGMTNKEIASRLQLSVKTVMHHSVAIYRKLGVRGRAEATAFAFRHGLLDPLGGVAGRGGAA